MAVQIWANMGITMMIFIAGLQTIPEELYEAAKIDGAGAWSVFRNVTWPLLTPAVNTNLILNIIGSLQAWQLFLVLIGYRNGTQVLGYLIFAQAFRPNVGECHERLPAGIWRRRFHRSILFGSRHWHVRAVLSAAQRKEDTGMNAAIASESPTKKQATRHINWGRIGSYAILLFFAVIYLGPLLMLLSTSLKTMPDFMKNATALPATLNFQNYVDAWEKANFPRYLTNTILYTVSATVIYVVTAVFVAFPIARGYVKGAGFLLTLYVIALFLPVALIPQFQLMLSLGVVQQSCRIRHAVSGEPDRHRHPGQLLQDAAQGIG